MIKYQDSFTKEEFDVKPVYSMFEERKEMIKYAFMKWQTEDWHALADAAMDLRELDARIKCKIEMESSQMRMRAEQERIFQEGTNKIIMDGLGKTE